MNNIAGFASGMACIGVLAVLMFYVINGLVQTRNVDTFETNMTLIMGLAMAAVIFMGIFIYSAFQSDLSKWQYIYMLYHFGFLISMVSLAMATFAQYSPIPVT